MQTAVTADVKRREEGANTSSPISSGHLLSAICALKSSQLTP